MPQDMEEKLHFARLVETQAKRYGNKTALRYKPIGEVNSLPKKKADDVKWKRMSWRELSEEVDLLSIALYSIGIQKDDKVGQFSQNMMENLVMDSAIWSNRAIMVPIYATSSSEQVQFIMQNSEMKVICVGEQEQYDTVCQVVDQCPALAHIVVFDPNVQMQQDNGRSLYYKDLRLAGTINTCYKEEMLQRRVAASPDDLFAIFYTSGTTGNPKGVMLAHEGAMQQMQNHIQLLPPLKLPHQKSICYLPLTHVFERMWTYLCMTCGIQVVINLRPQEILHTLKEVQPTMMCAVPRFWEKVYIAVQQKLDSYSPVMTGLCSWAMVVGRKYNIDYRRVGKKPGWFLRWEYGLMDKFVFRKIKNAIGLRRGTMFPAAGAAMGKEVAEFFLTMGVPIVHGYGLTETMATVSCYPPLNYAIGSIGDVIPNVQVKISDQGEICVKGPTVMKGYYKRDDANREAFTEDGYFRTGDAGFLKGGHLYMTERVKDLFKTSNGKYIAPQQIELMLTQDPYFEQVAVIADNRPYVTALIVPNMETLQRHAQTMGWPQQDTDALLHNPAVHKFYDARMKELQKGQANFELIKRFRFIPQGFTMAAGELTNTLKLRRSIIQKHYEVMIEEMYASKTI